MKTEFKNIEIIATAFKNRILTYRLNPTEIYQTPEAFLYDNLKNVVKLINMCLMKGNCLKVNYELFANFALPHSEHEQLKSFNTKNTVILRHTDLNENYLNAISTIKQKFAEFEHCESG